jgi:hypothetical protein
MWKSLKRWPVLVALLVALGMLAAGLVCLPFGSRVTRENCERIKVGMTEAGVRAILGKPWDDSLLDPEGASPLATAHFFLAQSDTGLLVPVEPRDRIGEYQKWIGSDFVLFVALTTDGRVARARLIPDHDRPQTSLPARVWRRLRARYGW